MPKPYGVGFAVYTLAFHIADPRLLRVTVTFALWTESVKICGL